MSGSPFFSIIIPTYNRANLILKTIHSFQDQTFKDFEILIIDDGSTDNTDELIKNIDDQRIKYYKKPNKGVSSARNYGVEKSSGSFINFFDSDDLAYPNHLYAAHQFISQHKDAKIIFFDYEWGDVAKKKVTEKMMRYSHPNSAILNSNFPHTNGAFLHPSVFEQVKFNETLVIAEDWDFWLKNSVRHKFYLGKIKTSYLVDHSARSVRNFKFEHLLEQKKALLTSLQTDALFFKKNRSRLHKIDSHMSSYIAIHAALNSQKKQVLPLFFKSILQDPLTIFNKRSLAILKHLLLTW